MTINKDHHARLRIDRLPTGQLIGRLKVYAFPFPIDRFFGFEGEEPEYDLEITCWDGRELTFIRHDPHWTQVFTGTANGREIKGTYTQTGTHNSGSWSGVLNYGLVTKTEEEHIAWQFRTRRALFHLMMPGNPTPITNLPLPPVQPENPIPLESPEGKYRDDNPQKGPQNYQIKELHFQYTLPNPYYTETSPYGSLLIVQTGKQDITFCYIERTRK